MSNILLDAFYSLGRRINKTGGKETSETNEGVVSDRFPELALEMANNDILKLTKKWQKKWNESDVKAAWEKKSEDSENYWKGKHFQRLDGDKIRPLVDNVIFESLETYLPQVTRRNPEPMVTVDEESEPNPESEAFAKKIQKYLGDIADELVLRLKLKKAARHWAIHLLGVAKFGWDINRDIPTLKILRPQKLILDPNATVDEDGYTGEFIGEHRKMQASMMIQMLSNVGAEADAEKTINDLVKGDTGTELGFIEWWTDEYMCWTMGDHVLLKKKNPHWNYDTQQPAPVDPITGLPPVDPQGLPQTIDVPGVNHLAVPKKPFIFLSLFNLGTQPVDDTSLIEQNLASQDLINKRLKQIDKNADNMNGGMVVSLERAGLTKDQAQTATKALRNGGTVAIPTGSPRDAIDRLPAQGLPADVYNQLADTRNRVLSIFGTRGSTPGGIENETTVRGKIISRTLDTDRIGGGISEYLEQFADKVYNWFIQLLYVYDDYYSQIKNKPKVRVSVKEGSLLPKDSTTIANQAIELANAGKMSVLDLYKRLDYPNPEELAANVWLEINAPEVLFADDPRIQQVMAAKQQQAGEPPKPPNQSISYRDLPPEGKAQMAANAGISLDAEAVAAHDELEKIGSSNINQSMEAMPTQ